MVAVPVSELDDLRRVLDDDGKPLPGAKVPNIPDATVVRLIEHMLLVRIVDDRMTELQRQGRLGFYQPATGDEATHFAVAPLLDSDWVFPSHREHGAWFWRGYTIQQYIDQLFGNVDDPIKGRQMPGHRSASWLHLVSISTPPGTQIPQAVGVGYAAKVSGTSDVAMAYFGEAACAGSDFHVGMNFAAVWKAPCIFVCRNAGARSVASRAVGYGMRGIRVDGNDVLAIWQAAEEATDRARAGLGPTLIEAHTSPRDPILKLRAFARHRGLWSEAAETALADRYHQEITGALAASERKPAPAFDTMFDDVFEDPPWHLRDQREYVRTNRCPS